MKTSPQPDDRLVPGRRWGRSAAPALLVLGAALAASTARGEGRCSDEVCVELLLPPSVKEVGPNAALELLVLLPAPAEASVNVKVVLRQEGAQPRCFARYAAVQRGTSWTRVTFRLDGGKSPVAPGDYAIGVQRVKRAGVEDDACPSRADGARFLTRRLRIKG